MDALGDRVALTPYGPGDGLPLFVQPRDPALREDVAAALGWFREKREAIAALLSEAGALAFRGFAINATADFEAWLEAYEAPDFGYIGGAAPRGQLAPRVFESTRIPAEEVLGLHQEMAYLPNWPRMVAFYCRLPSISGGETFLADMRKVTAAIDPTFIAALEARGGRTVRNFRDRADSIGVPFCDLFHRSWQDAFGTTDRASPMADCAAMGLTGEWLTDGSFAVTYDQPGFVDHPVSKAHIWFNQFATMAMSRASMGPNFALFEDHYGDRRPLPYAIGFADGTPIPQAWLLSALDAYQTNRIGFAWSHGDILLLDNILVAHGRNSFTGLRDIQVGLLN